LIKQLLKIPFLGKRLANEIFDVKYIDKNENLKLEFKFKAGGKKYYKYIKDDQLPLPRFHEMELRLLEIESRISRETLFNFSKALKKYAEAKDFINVASLAGEFEKRLELLYDPELLVRFLCGLYIREDQIKNADVWNQRIEDEKFNEIMKENENGNLSFFFQQSNLRDHVGFSNTSDSESENLLSEPIIQNQLKQSRLFNQMILNLISKQK